MEVEDEQNGRASTTETLTLPKAKKAKRTRIPSGTQLEILSKEILTPLEKESIIMQVERQGPPKVITTQSSQADNLKKHEDEKKEPCEFHSIFLMPIQEIDEQVMKNQNRYHLLNGGIPTKSNIQHCMN